MGDKSLKTTTPGSETKSALRLMAEEYSLPVETLKKTLMETAFSACKTEAQFATAVMVAQMYKLNPFLREIHAFASKGGVVPVVGVDGWIKLVINHPDYDGFEQIENEDEDGNVKSITTKMYRKGVSHPAVVTERMNECKRNTDPWNQMPVRMLGHKSYIQCARKAFGFSGIYDEDEAERITMDTVKSGKPEVKMPKAKVVEEEPIDVTPETELEPAPKQETTKEMAQEEVRALWDKA